MATAAASRLLLVPTGAVFRWHSYCCGVLCAANSSCQRQRLVARLHSGHKWQPTFTAGCFSRQPPTNFCHYLVAGLFPLLLRPALLAALRPAAAPCLAIGIIVAAAASHQSREERRDEELEKIAPPNVRADTARAKSARTRARRRGAGGAVVNHVHVVVCGVSGGVACLLGCVSLVHKLATPPPLLPPSTRLYSSLLASPPPS